MVGQQVWRSPSLSDCAKHGERAAGVSDKAPGLEAPQEQHAVNQCEEAPLICVCRGLKGTMGVLGSKRQH